MSEQVNSSQAIEILKGSHKILLAPSTPDGDSIGSALAMMVVLRKLGKEVRVVVADQIPEYLKFLPHVDQIEHSLGGSKDFVITLDTNQAEVDHMKYEVEQGKINIIITPKEGKFTPHDISFSKSSPDFDLIVTVDTGDLVQLGKLKDENAELFGKTPLLNIDHHASNGRFGTANFLDFSVASTTQMLIPVLKALENFKGEKLIDEDVATLLLTGLITDTGSFQHSNTSPQAFEAAADLLDLGARQQEIIKHIFKTKSLATLKLWGRVLSKIQYDDAHRFVYSTITEQDLEDTGASSEDSGGIIDELMSNAPRAEVVLLFKEKADGLNSGSLRATGNLADVSEIAGRMGGGGHVK
ncbi:MAG: DHH family phosphoesterase, partial [Patescibacteria group bacterium]